MAISVTRKDRGNLNFVQIFASNAGFLYSIDSVILGTTVSRSLWISPDPEESGFGRISEAYLSTKPGAAREKASE